MKVLLNLFVESAANDEATYSKICVIWWFVVGALQLQWSCGTRTEFVQFLGSFSLGLFLCSGCVLWRPGDGAT